MVPAMFPQLKSIQTLNIDVKDLKLLLSCPNLEEIGMDVYIRRQDRDIDDDELGEFIEKHPNSKNFKKLMLFGNYVKSSSLVAIAKYCQNIETLVLYTSVPPEVTQFPRREKRFEQLKEFEILQYTDLNYVTPVLEYVLLAAQNIEKIKILPQRQSSYDQFFSQLLSRNSLSQVKQLKLKVRRIEDISMNTLKMLSDLPSVRELHVATLNSSVRESLKKYASEKNYDIDYDN